MTYTSMIAILAEKVYLSDENLSEKDIIQFMENEAKAVSFY